MKIAVLLSCYNGTAYLPQQLRSIWDQVCSCPIDIWVRDDGSSDETRALLEQYAQEGKLHWYTGPNLRPARSFLDLVSHCPGYDFYAFADQDDFWLPDKLERGIQAITGQTGPALYCSNAQLVDSKLESLGRNVYRESPYTNFETLCFYGGILGCTMVFNEALAQKLRICTSPEHMIMHDFYAAVVCGAYGGEIFYDSQPSMLYRQHGHNVVGVSRGKLGALRDRFQAITRRAPITVAQQTRSILKCCPELPQGERLDWLKKVAEYDRSFFRALSMACSGKTHYCNKNKALTFRLALLLRNR